ncbi:hypothetical protein GW17_00057481, partial [Ensete ventricosum]
DHSNDLLAACTPLPFSRPQQRILPTHRYPLALAIATTASMTSSFQYHYTTALLTTCITAANTK